MFGRNFSPKKYTLAMKESLTLPKGFYNRLTNGKENSPMQDQPNETDGRAGPQGGTT